MKLSSLQQTQSDLQEEKRRNLELETELQNAKDKLLSDGDYWEGQVQAREEKIGELEGDLKLARDPENKKFHKTCHDDYNKQLDDEKLVEQERDQWQTTAEQREEALKKLREQLVEKDRVLQEQQNHSAALERQLQAEKKSTGDLKARVGDLLKRPTSADYDEQVRKVRKLEEENKTLSVSFDDQARARNLALDLADQAKADLEPIINLHPQLKRLSSPSVSQLASALVENVVLDLNDVWQHIPQDENITLVTPNTLSVQPLLEKLKKGVQKAAEIKHNLEGRITELEKDIKRWKLDWGAACDRENDVTEKLTLCADEILAWEKATKQLDRGNVLSPEQAETRILQLIKAADLSPILRLHPAFARLTNPAPSAVAEVVQTLLSEYKATTLTEEDPLQRDAHITYLEETIFLLKQVIREIF